MTNNFESCKDKIKELSLFLSSEESDIFCCDELSLAKNISNSTNPRLITEKSVNGLRIAQTNIRSINNKITELQLFLQNYDPDIMCLTETWLSSDMPSSLFLPQNFSVVRWDNRCRYKVKFS